MSEKNPFEDIFGLLPNHRKLELIQEARVNGIYKTAQDYADSIGISVNGLYRRLRREIENTMPVAVSSLPKAEEKKTGKKELVEVKLTREEKVFLKDLKSGKANLEDASRLVAVKVFDKMLRNPDNLNFLDFFRVELLKIKKMEVETKKTWAMQFVNRMFGGAELPPPVCPHCHRELVRGGTHILSGDILEDVESIPTTSSS